MNSGRYHDRASPGDFRNRIPSIKDLDNRFVLEFRAVSLATHHTSSYAPIIARKCPPDRGQCKPVTGTCIALNSVRSRTIRDDSAQNSRRDFCLFLQPVGNQIGNSDQRVEKLIINPYVAFVLRQVAFPMGLVEHSPLGGREIQGVLGTLEHEVAILGPVASVSQSR